ncbi:MAG: DUF1499 domain-containing protein [Pseudomonadota bacterium]
MTDTDPRPWWRRLNTSAGALTVLTLLALVIAGPGHRFGLLDFTLAVQLSLGTALLAALGLIAAIGALLAGRIGHPKRLGLGSVVALVVCGALLVQFGVWAQRANSVPSIHDITTDTEDPPAFVAIAPLRADAPNPVDYAGESVAEQQRSAYPDLATLELDQVPGDVLATVESYAAEQGWEIVESNLDEGRLEATSTTFWFGYKDDIVVRARWSGSGTSLDVRSKSRVGRSDLGTNAERIRGLLAVLKPPTNES